MRRILPGKVVSLGMKCTTDYQTRIDICEGMRYRAGDVLKQIEAGENVLLVSQESIPPQWRTEVEESINAEGFQTHVHLLPEGESAKSPGELLKLWNHLQELSFERRDCILAVGGGAVTDIAGFAASTYLRGINSVLLPTTLLAQVDAAIGGKTAINLERGKNLAGAIYMPAAILIDTDVLATLPARQLQSGMGEIVKYAYIEKTIAEASEYRQGPKSLLDVLETTFPNGASSADPAMPSIITTCARMKLAVVAVDPLERRLRRCLNLGHTLGHAIEKASDYEVSHGEAVSIGTIFALDFACAIGRLARAHVERARRLCSALGLPTALPPGLAVEALFSAMMHDKKRVGNNLKFVLPVTAPGHVDIDVSVESDSLKSFLYEFAR